MSHHSIQYDLHLSLQHILIADLLCARKWASFPNSPSALQPSPCCHSFLAPSFSISLSNAHSSPGARASRIGWRLNCSSLLCDINWRGHFPGTELHPCGCIFPLSQEIIQAVTSGKLEAIGGAVGGHRDPG